MIATTMFLIALAIVESGCDDSATGARGEVGRYQISQAYLDDANEFNGTGYTLDEMRDPVKATKVVMAYIRRYAEARPWHDVARIHNGGPRGAELESTMAFADRVTMQMEPQD